MTACVLVVVAHPDDETLGCGGTICRLTHDGVPTFIAALGDGVTSRGGVYDGLTARRDQFISACKMQGAQAVGDHIVLRDQRFDESALLDLAKIVESLLARYKPTWIYTHSQHDLNLDHRMVHDAVMTAARPVKGQSVREIYGFEVPSATEWGDTTFRPTLFVDVTASIDRKIEAMALYNNEQPVFPHPRSEPALRALAAWRGSACGASAAEAFEVLRIIR